jgi:general secretion pathway protein N
MKRAGFFVVILVATLVATLPATLMDLVVASATNGRVRLAGAEGNFWQGSGIVTTIGRNRSSQAWRPVSWRFHWVGTGAPAVAVHESDQPVARLEFTLRGPRLSALDADLPVDMLVHAIPHPVARAGWHGYIHLTSTGLTCTWHQVCDGELRAVWHAAGSDIAPNHRFGSYLLALQLTGGNAAMELTTLSGDLLLSGQGSANRTGETSFSGTVAGDPALIDRLPNIMDRNARSTGKAGIVSLNFP